MTPAAKAPAKEKLVKVSRAQRNPRAAPEAEPVQFSVAAPQAQPAEVAPLVATPAPVEPAATEPAPVVPAEPAPAETAPAVAEHVDAPPQESPMPAAADAPQAGADAAPQ
ncbi:MAG TPA: hypothetical protein VFW28_01180 [Micropepsaceae bacterium]|nr:hypothetical protein [Micropepsaceae bacterium]